MLTVGNWNVARSYKFKLFVFFDAFCDSIVVCSMRSLEQPAWMKRYVEEKFIAYGSSCH